MRGIATARGGATAHAAILARALGIPAVVGLGAALLAVADGTELALDGEEGAVDVAPGADGRSPSWRPAGATAEAAAAEALARAQEPAATRDGTRVEVVANVGSAAEVRPALAQGAEGVGLLRTEFLFLDRADPPGEEEQVAVLREIAAALEGRPLVVRTLDAGADKPLPFLAQAPEDNPFLGVRGIRLSLARPDLFDTQLRAIVRVAAEHRVARHVPDGRTLEELLAARERLDAARAALGLDPPLEVGVMVEVPGLALAAERVAPHVDFFSVGTNDLAQYTMAAERGSAALAPLLDGPAAAGARADRRRLRGGRGARPLGRRVRRAGRRPGRRRAPRRPRRARAVHGGGPDPRGQGGAAARPTSPAAQARRAAAGGVPPPRMTGRTPPSQPLVGIPTVTSGRLRSARLIAAGTVLRILLTPVVMALVLAAGPDGGDGETLAAVLFAVAAATDWVDGRLARAWGVTTKLGSFLDTTADKLLVSGVLIALLEVDRVSPWIVAIIVGRELVIISLRGVIAAGGGTVMEPSMLGKLKTSVQCLAILLAILRPGDEIGGLFLDQWAMLAAAALTLWSAVDYLARALPAISRQD